MILYWYNIGHYYPVLKYAIYLPFCDQGHYLSLSLGITCLNRSPIMTAFVLPIVVDINMVLKDIVRTVCYQFLVLEFGVRVVVG